MNGIFITGTDTGVGKTVVSAGLLLALSRKGIASRYWKPVQTGEDDDTASIVELAHLDEESYRNPCYQLKAPLSPNVAAEREGQTLSRQHLLAQAQAFKTSGLHVVEGAGGLMVPLSNDFLMVDLVKDLGMPVLLVAPNRLGAINQTLLSLQLCRLREIKVAGVLLNLTDEDLGNRKSIETFEAAPILGEIPRLANAREAAHAISQCLTQNLDLILRVGTTPKQPVCDILQEEA